MWIIDSEDDRREGDYLSVSKAEIEVFNLDPDWLPAIMGAHLRFQYMVGEAIGGKVEDDQAQRDRILWNQFLTVDEHGQLDYEPEDAVRFMVEACEVPVDQAYAWLARLDAQYWREGIFTVDAEEASASYRERMIRRRRKITTAVAGL